MCCFVFDVWWLDISFIWLESIKRAPGSWQQSNDTDERRGFLLCITFSVPSTVTQNLFLSLVCCPNPALIAHRLIYHQLFYPSRTTAFSSRLSRSLFLCHGPYCPPHSFNACFVHPSLPLPLSLSLHFSRTQLDMWMNTWNSPWGVECSVSMLMTPALLNKHYTAQQWESFGLFQQLVFHNDKY